MYYFALFSMLIAGLTHLMIAPTHYAHATAHGIFFAGLGLAQLSWTAVFWRWPTMRVQIAWGGLSLSGGIIVLWLIAHNLGTPFGGHTSIEWDAIITKTAEMVGGLALFGYLASHTISDSRAQQTGLGLGLCVGVGVLLWGGGRLAEPLFPQWVHLHPHDGHIHDSSAGHDHHHDHPHELPTTFEPVQSNQAEMSNGYNWDLPAGFPPPRVPENNPMTAEKVDLGRYLFYDKRLSGNETQACATCHLQALAFADGKVVPEGSTGERHSRNSQALVNVVYNASLTWANPVLVELEQQILVPIFGEFPKELGIVGHETEVLARFQNDTAYQQRFAAAFPDDAEPITYQNIVKALASFIRSLTSSNSAYDRYVYQADKTALSPSAKRGLNLFLSERLECHHCHIGFNFSASTMHANSTFIEKPFQNNGLYNLDNQGSYPRGNTGLHHITGQAEDMGKFRPPTLRNIELTAPYMHDGSIATLEDVIEHYADGGRLIETGEHAGDGSKNPYKSGLVGGFELTDQETKDLINFLKSLTDEEFITNPRFSDPFVMAAPPETKD